MGWSSIFAWVHKYSKTMETFVNDYKIHLVEAGKNNLVLHNVNNQDLFNLLEILLSRSGRTDGKKEKAIDYTRKHKVDKAVIMTVAGTMNGKIDYNELIGEGEKGMVSVFQETWNEGEAKGIIEMGNDFGLSEEDILARLQKKLNVSLQKAQEYLYAIENRTLRYALGGLPNNIFASRYVSYIPNKEQFIAYHTVTFNVTIYEIDLLYLSRNCKKNSLERQLWQNL